MKERISYQAIPLKGCGIEITYADGRKEIYPPEKQSDLPVPVQIPGIGYSRSKSDGRWEFVRYQNTTPIFTKYRSCEAIPS